MAGIGIPGAGCNLFCPLSLLTLHLQGGVGHSTNNPCEAGKLGQGCFLQGEIMAGQLGGGTGAEAHG